ncbi:hypothetical protein [Roseiconus lacunae]|uniref:Uncharacterized protein n=1 Tax=Roseiconus lacunae TaxID=2605694 RepID=A0ABT7PDX4_9BACT|nr:hypothetical protein [Roseiconus lacunae]MDM4014688.1 hypothetical protein [Roseiconus lacunae]
MSREPSKPTIEQLTAFVHSNRCVDVRQVDPLRFWQWAERAGWMNAQGKPNRDWRCYVRGNTHQPDVKYQNARYRRERQTR